MVDHENTSRFLSLPYSEGTTHLWVLYEGFPVVETAPCSVGGRPLAVHLGRSPRLRDGEKRRVHHTADGHVCEVLAIIVERHTENIREALF